MRENRQNEIMFFMSYWRTLVMQKENEQKNESVIQKLEETVESY